MNKLKIYTIYDAKVQAYLQPFFLRTHGEAIRAVTELATDLKHQFNKHAEDFTLFYNGEFDQQTGELVSIVAQPIGRMIEFKHQDSDDVDAGLNVPAFLRNQTPLDYPDQVKIDATKAALDVQRNLAKS